jgi:hypothetical protein
MKRPSGYDGLMERMARELGLEIIRDRAAIGLSQQDITRLMQRCAACSEAEDCRKRLGRPEAQDLPPAYCSNRKLLLFLAKRLAEEGD